MDKWTRLCMPMGACPCRAQVSEETRALQHSLSRFSGRQQRREMEIRERQELLSRASAGRVAKVWGAVWTGWDVGVRWWHGLQFGANLESGCGREDTQMEGDPRGWAAPGAGSVGADATSAHPRCYFCTGSSTTPSLHYTSSGGLSSPKCPDNPRPPTHASLPDTHAHKTP
eukprot:365480-Chlamydomonas_euryale.AAC.24